MRKAKGIIGGIPIRILIVGDDFSLPEGLAATARVRCYARGLSENGSSVGVLCIAPSFLPGREPSWAAASGRIPGAEFRYVDGTPTQSASFLVRQMRKVLRGPRFLKAVRQMAYEIGGVDLIHHYGETSHWLIASKLAASAFGAVLSQELCELPGAYRAKSFRSACKGWIFRHVALGCPDYVIAISDMLERWASEGPARNARVIRVPVMAEADRFPAPEIEGAKGKSVVFSGNLKIESEAKGLLRAFRFVADTVPDARLIVTGSTGAAEAWGDPRAVASGLGIGDRVAFLGLLAYDELPSLLASASVLALPRSRGVSSEASFPTKLAEYMMSGTPVLATAVGDVPAYLRDGWNGYLAPPNDDAAFSEKLLHVLTHLEEARAVGLRGRDTALEHFDCARACKAILVACARQSDGTTP